MAVPFLVSSSPSPSLFYHCLCILEHKSCLVETDVLLQWILTFLHLSQQKSLLFSSLLQPLPAPYILTASEAPMTWCNIMLWELIFLCFSYFHSLKSKPMHAKYMLKNWTTRPFCELRVCLLCWITKSGSAGNGLVHFCVHHKQRNCRPEQEVNK